MAFQTKVIKLTSPTSTGNQATTGVGFQPKAILFFLTDQQTETSSANMQMGFGIAVSSTSRMAAAVESYDAAGTTSDGRSNTNAKCLIIIDQNTNALIDADLVSMDSDGFTLNFTTVQAQAYNIYALCLGGSDLTNVFLKQFQLPTSTGNFSQTGVGFQPDCILFTTTHNASLPPAQTGVSTASFGFALSSTSRFVTSVRGGAGVGVTNTESSQLSSRVILLTSGALGVSQAVDFVSMDSDGFTLNQVTGTTARYCWALCLKGGQYKITTLNQPTSTGSQAITGIGFTPTGLLFNSYNQAANTSTQSQMRWTFGIASSSTARASIWGGNKNGNVGSKCDQNNDSTKCIKLLTEAGGGSPTLNAAADLTSMDSDGFTLNWSTADATQREIGVLAFGSNVSADGGSGLSGLTASLGVLFNRPSH